MQGGVFVGDDALLIPGRKHPAQGHQVVHDGIEVGFLLLRLAPDEARTAGRIDDIALVHENQDPAVLLRPAQAALLAFAQRDLDRARPLALARRTLEGFIDENGVHGLSGSGFPDPFSYSAEKDPAVLAELLVETEHCR